MKQQRPQWKTLAVALVGLTAFWFHHIVQVVRAQAPPNTDSARLNTQARLIVQLGHGAGVRSVAFSPDGKYVLTAGSYDNTARLWEVETGRELRTFAVIKPLMSIAYSRDGKYVLTGSADNNA